MGWDFGRQTKQELLTKLRAGAEHHRLVGNHLWTVRRDWNGDGGRYICLYLLASEHGCWGFKDLAECEHPYYYDCPASLLELAPETHPEWRAKVREYHAAKANARARANKLAVGDVVQLPEGYRPATLEITSTKPLRGRGPDGREYRIGPRHVAALVKEPERFGWTVGR
jgi:hypothetical protein